MKCALCESKDCRQGRNCTKTATDIDYAPAKETMRIASEVESKYMELTRLEELILFCKKMKFKRVRHRIVRWSSPEPNYPNDIRCGRAAGCAKRIRRSLGLYRNESGRYMRKLEGGRGVEAVHAGKWYLAVKTGG